MLIDPIAEIRAIIAECGSQDRAALKLKLPQSLLSDTLNGKKKHLPPKLLKALKARVVYERIPGR